jgi:pimeloyl-ACP methyl ester carboxylesterase
VHRSRTPGQQSRIRDEDAAARSDEDVGPMTTMNTPLPHVRESGAGTSVVCLHANASSSAQWRPLMERLASRFRVVAPDLYGAGNSAEWPSDRVITVADELALLRPVLAAAGTPFVLVGHSYGGAVALIAALAERQRLAALVVYEPTLFALIDPDAARPNDADGIRDAVDDAGQALDAGDLDGAARRFIDYWSGAGSWDRVPAHRKPAMTAAVTKVRRWRHALFSEPTPLAAFAALDVPVLVLSGERSTAAARGVVERLMRVLPRAELVEFAGLGHMGPVTDPATVDPVIAEFIERAKR